MKTGFPRIYFNGGGDKLKLLTIEQWGTGTWTSMQSAFAGCANMIVQASDTPDLSGVTDTSRMFNGPSSFNQSIDSWNVSNATTMNSMFEDATAFNQNLRNQYVFHVRRSGGVQSAHRELEHH